MSSFKDTSYFDIGTVDGNDIKVGSRVIGHVANNQVTDANDQILGYVVGNTIVNLRDSVMAYFDDGEIYDGHHHIIGHYEGGDHTGAGGAAYMIFLTKKKVSKKAS
ncbi:hypothetical protein HBN50_17275 [Halobacteriovorax sp. GB3]|uniref:5-fold beta-flower protein n=1 Tax=Halobacteriovorax sp. GB3 TaxID=2719615 RepID=UPI0023604A24|nr:hypothetical protein [Halobacteriovorax sp. GB3]MDD0854859.1 hypothetical protein [Halobacteriovorax sp. GB3]